MFAEFQCHGGQRLVRPACAIAGMPRPGHLCRRCDRRVSFVRTTRCNRSLPRGALPARSRSRRVNEHARLRREQQGNSAAPLAFESTSTNEQHGFPQHPPSKVIRVCDSRSCICETTKVMAERVGFEFTRKRSFNNIKRTAGTVKQLEDNGKQY
jgi:hypothetical protein